MNLQGIVAVLLRLMALNIVLQTLAEIPSHISTVADAFKASDLAALNTSALLALAVINVLFVCTILLWAYAVPLSRFITARVATDVSVPSLSLADLYSVGFVGLGAFFAASYLPHATNWVLFLCQAAVADDDETWREDFTEYDLTEVFIPFVAGVLLIVKGRRWAVSLARKHLRGPVVQDDAPQNVG